MPTHRTVGARRLRRPSPIARRIADLGRPLPSSTSIAAAATLLGALLPDRRTRSDLTKRELVTLGRGFRPILHLRDHPG